MPISRRFEERFEAYLAARLHGEHHHVVKPVFRGTLTVSREAGARATPICEMLADYLSEEDDSAACGWTLHDKDLVARIIEEKKLPESAVRFLGEDRPNRIDDYFAQVLKTHPTEWTLFHHTVDTIRKLARLGNAIIIGRGGNCIAADLENAFHLRLIGTESVRLAAIQRERHLEKRAALAYLRTTDKARRDYVRSHLRHNIDDPLAYHAVIRTDNLSNEVLARMIGDLFMDWVAAKEQTAGKLLQMP